MVYPPTDGHPSKYLPYGISPSSPELGVELVTC